jgi:hypothetical protein
LTARLKSARGLAQSKTLTRDARRLGFWRDVGRD